MGLAPRRILSAKPPPEAAKFATVTKSLIVLGIGVQSRHIQPITNRGNKSKNAGLRIEAVVCAPTRRAQESPRRERSLQALCVHGRAPTNLEQGPAANPSSEAVHSLRQRFNSKNHHRSHLTKPAHADIETVSSSHAPFGTLVGVLR